MYGHFVHQAVIANKEPKSGITIHFVNEEYDKGEILLQKECAISYNETEETLAKKIHELEMEFLPKAIETLL